MNKDKLVISSPHGGAERKGLHWTVAFDISEAQETPIKMSAHCYICKY